METSFPPPKKLSEGREKLLAVASFGATNSVFKTTEGNNNFSISIPG